MDFDSNHLVLVVVAVVIFALIRTLVCAGKDFQLQKTAKIVKVVKETTIIPCKIKF